MSIKYTCSLGPHCHSSYLLKSNNLKKASYPFDWIFTNHSIIQKIVDNNFIDFLNKEYYININNKKCGHKLYHDTMFWHHNPLLNNADYQYFNRCTSRFQNMLLSDEEKLFIYLVKDVKEIDENLFENNIQLLSNCLRKHTNNFRILAIVIYPNKEKNNYKFVTIENVDFLYVDVLSSSNGIQFLNDKDNKYLSIILNVKYKFDLKEIH
jgi:hypothetical protein